MGTVTPNAQILKGLPYFADLPEDLLARVCQNSRQVEFGPGTVIFEEGSDSKEMYVVVDGEVEVTKRVGSRETRLATLGRGQVVGEIALLDHSPRTATVTTSARSTMIEVPGRAFEDLLKDSNVMHRMFRTMISRLRGIEEVLRHEERMAALGRMAAQLTHELVNPAAAIGRSATQLSRLHDELRHDLDYVTVRSFGVNPPEPTSSASLTGLERADREQSLLEWLSEMGLEDPEGVASALAERGWTVQLLSESTAGMELEEATRLARWIGLRAAVDQVVGEVKIAAGRISDLIQIVKEYSYLGQAPRQEVDPVIGIRNTLVLLKHKLKNIEVIADLREGEFLVEAPGRDLNQVWTNLIDNASDAMNLGGTLTINAVQEGGSVAITVSDTGPGIPRSVMDQIFDPFFTTKEPGRGTGLGLHTVHTIVRRIGGDITVRSSPRGTSFKVTLPAIS